MPRPRLIRSSELPYHLVARTNNREWFVIRKEQCWSLLKECLSKAAEKYDVRVHAALLMSNHLHLIVTTPNANVDSFMRYLMSMLTRRILTSAGRINHIFGGRYGWSILETPHATAYVFKYLFRNPIRAGICNRVEDYPFSTVFSLDDFLSPLPQRYAALIPVDEAQRLAWLNQYCSTFHEEMVRLALRRARFGFSHSREHSARLRALTDAYGVLEVAEGSVTEKVLEGV